MTGGLGGVHRQGESTMDISADLTELGRTPVAVISAGIKSVLDIGRTLEYLVRIFIYKFPYLFLDVFHNLATTQILRLTSYMVFFASLRLLLTEKAASTKCNS